MDLVNFKKEVLAAFLELEETHLAIFNKNDEGYLPWVNPNQNHFEMEILIDKLERQKETLFKLLDFEPEPELEN